MMDVVTKAQEPAGPVPEMGAARDAVDKLVRGGLLDELMAQVDEGSLQLTGEGGFLPELVKRVLEAGLAAELSEQLGYERHDRAGHGSGNSRNGSTPKRLGTEVGDVDLATPRDRNGSFEPRLVPKGQRRVDGLSDMIISLYAGGMTIRDIQAHLERTLGTELSHETIANITDAVAEEVKAWQARPLEPRRFLANVANHCGVRCRIHRCIACCGVWSPRQRRGRSFSSAAMRSSWSAVQTLRSVPFGKYCRSSPLMFHSRRAARVSAGRRSRCSDRCVLPCVDGGTS